MSPLAESLREIAARAMTLEERGNAAPRRGGGRPPGAPAGSTEPWCRAVAGGDRKAFRRRLSWDGLTEERVRARLAAPVAMAAAGLPDWTRAVSGGMEKCGEVLDAIARGEPPPELAAFPPDEAPGFAEIWVPFLRHARGRFAERLGDDSSPLPAVLGPGARASLEGALLAQMSWLGTRTLYECFALFRRERMFAREPAAQGDAPAAPGRELYLAFVRSLLSDGLAGFFLEHAPLARLIGVVVDQWVDSGAELIARLRADRRLLRDRFGADGEVVGMKPGLSDRHAGGRTVVALEFSSGARLIYKPRGLRLEATWNAFVRRLGTGAEGSLPVARVLARDGYGYVEFLEPGTLAGPREVETYFRRAGGLLCVSWLLGANDLHMENVIATSAGPVVIDAESLLQPDPRPARRSARRPSSADASERALRRLSESFLRTGLLTLPQLDAAGAPVDLGGLRGTGGHLATLARRSLRARNTDAMEIVFEPAAAMPESNLPVSEGRRLRPDSHREATLEGFAAMLRRFVEKREAIAGAGGWLEAFAGEKTRFLFRPSDVYARLLDELSEPRYLRSAILRGFALDAINRVFVGERARPAAWPLAVQERRELERFDIPFFRIPVDGTALRAGGESVRGLVAASGLAAAKRRVRRLSERELGRQRELLRRCLVGPEGERPARRPRTGPLEGDLLGLSEDIGDAVLAAVPRRGVLPRLSLYDGALGVALFLAALSQATGRERHRREALAVLGPLERALRTKGTASSRAAEEGIGAAQGLGSLMYGLVTIQRFLPEYPALEYARRAASLLTPRRAASDRRFDLQSGGAGAIVGLLAVHGATGDAEALAAAAAYGDSLLRNRRDLGRGRWGWPSAEGTCLAGMAHGTSGIALALARLSRATGRGDFGDAARRADRYEDALFDAARENWPVLVPGRGREPERLFRTAWCHGSPGVALSRIARAAAAGESGEHIESALRAVRRAGVLSADHACCGNVGIVEAFLSAGEAFAREDWIAEARGRAAVVLHGALVRGAFRLADHPADPAGISFFRGLSGIGYALLRAAAPGRLPCVLIFE